MIGNDTLSPPFVGRREELAHLMHCLRGPERLVTLVGPGGCGKTRLARQVAIEQADTYDDVHVIPLAPLSSGEFIVSTIADAVGFTRYSTDDPLRQLLDYLRTKALLLVLDGFEHLAQHASLLDTLLAACPKVRLLVTSRVPLGLKRERLLRVEGLPVPPEDANPEALRSYGAVELFVASARRADPGFALHAAAAPHVAHICRMLEGLPLGIELAAGWVRVLSCADIAEEIESNLDFLATADRDLPVRHRSLRAVFDSSWKLLTAQERRALEAMTVFRGGFHPKAAREVVQVADAVLDSLVNQSLLRYRADLNRYEMPLALRQYVEEQMDDPDASMAAVRVRHSRYYAAFLQEREHDVKYERQKEALEEIALEIENVRRAWHHALARRDDATMLRAVSAICHFYNVRGWVQEADELLHAALATLEETVEAGAQGARDELMLRLQVRASWFAMKLGNYAEAERRARAGLAAAQRREASAEVAHAAYSLGYTRHRLGDHSEAGACFRKCLDIYRALEDPMNVINALNALGNVAHTVGNVRDVKRLREESLRICEEIGYLSGMAVVLNNLGSVYIVEGAYDRARALYERSRAISQELGNQRGVGTALVSMATAAHYQGKLAEAQRLYEQGRDAYAASGHRWGVAYVNLSLGWVLRDQGRYSPASALCEKGLAQSEAVQNPWGIAYAHILLGGIAGDLKDEVEAAQHLRTGLRQALEMNTLPLLLRGVVASAHLRHRQGDDAQAARYLRVVVAHPAAEHHVRDEAQRLLGAIAPPPASTEASPPLQALVEDIVGARKR